MKAASYHPGLRFGFALALVFPTMIPAQEARALTEPPSRATIDTQTLIGRKDLVQGKRIILKGWKGELKDARMIDLDGNDISALLAPKTEGGSVTMVPSMKPFIIKMRLPQKVAFSEQRETLLPGGLVQTITTGNHTKVVWFRLFCSISPRPAPWIERSGNYVTQMKFTVRPTEGTAPSLALPYPITVSLEFDGMIAPNIPTFTIDQAGLEHQKVVELRFKPSTMQPKLLVRSTISDSDLTLDALPRLELRPARTVLLGFGLEDVTINVAYIRPDGQPAETLSRSDVDIEIQGTARRERTSGVVIPSGGSRAEFDVRSAGLGKVTIKATLGAVSATTELNQRFPTGPLLAALLGGALGGLARRWVKHARQRSAARHLLEGVVIGLVAFVAAVLGVGYLNLPAAIAATEAGAFLTSVLCGFAGVAVLIALTDRLKAGKSE